MGLRAPDPPPPRGGLGMRRVSRVRGRGCARLQRGRRAAESRSRGGNPRSSARKSLVFFLTICQKGRCFPGREGRDSRPRKRNIWRMAGKRSEVPRSIASQLLRLILPALWAREGQDPSPGDARRRGPLSQRGETQEPTVGFHVCLSGNLAMYSQALVPLAPRTDVIRVYADRVHPIRGCGEP